MKIKILIKITNLLLYKYIILIKIYNIYYYRFIRLIDSNILVLDRKNFINL